MSVENAVPHFPGVRLKPLGNLPARARGKKIAMITDGERE
jgi:hypothetical protein